MPAIVLERVQKTATSLGVRVGIATKRDTQKSLDVWLINKYALMKTALQRLGFGL